MRVRPMTIFAAVYMVAVAVPVVAADIPIATGSPTSISPDRIWTEIAGPDVRTAYSQLRKRFPRFTAAARVNRVFILDTARLEAALSGAPQRPLLGSRPSGGKDVTLPLPDGEFVHFHVFETPVFPPPLAAQLPDFRTYSAIGVERPTMTASIEKTVMGWGAMIFDEDGIIAITAVAPSFPTVFVSLTPTMMDRLSRFQCKSPGGSAVPPPPVVPLPASFAGTTRVYRLAIAARGEYTRSFLFNSADSVGIAKIRAIHEIGVLISRMSEIFTHDFGIQFVGVARQPDLVFEDPQTDPFNGTDACSLKNQNNTFLMSTLQAANFDVGHLVGTIGEGCATRPCVCDVDKGEGASGIEKPFGDPFHVGYVAHELGHQFGASHTFNALSCVNIVSTFAFEPGSGSTIMGYAPICAPGQNVVQVSDDYYHAANVAQVVGELNRTGGSGSCASPSSNGDHPPTITMPQSTIQVPKGTPFQLSVIGGDPDRDTLLYSWEQFDVAEATAPPNNDSDGKLRPMFRSLRLTEPTRFFPSIDNLVHGRKIISFETSPQSGKPLHFRVLARDQRGGFAFTDATVNVITTAGPFAIILPKPQTSWKAGTQKTITWDTAHTPDAPLSCLAVRILFSADGGKSFSTLVASTPNDGSEIVTAPATPTNAAVIRIEGINQAFFAVSRIFRVKQ